MPLAPLRHVVAAPRSGYLAALDAGLVGRAAVALGAGRTRVEDEVDPAVGATLQAKPGADAGGREPLGSSVMTGCKHTTEPPTNMIPPG